MYYITIHSITRYINNVFSFKLKLMTYRHRLKFKKFKFFLKTYCNHFVGNETVFGGINWLLFNHNTLAGGRLAYLMVLFIEIIGLKCNVCIYRICL